MLDRFKIYGCRNSGTNYLSLLVERNIDIHYVGNGAGKHKHELPRYFHNERSLVLMITKNPYSWLLSRKRKPHMGALGQRMKKASWKEYLEIPQGYFAHSIGKWCLMGQAFLEASNNWGCEHIKYESLLRGGKEVLTSLSEKYDLETTDKFFSDIKNTTRPNPDNVLSGSRYPRRDYYKKGLWRNDYTPQKIKLVNEKIDNRVVKSLGYTIEKPKSYE